MKRFVILDLIKFIRILGICFIICFFGPPSSFTQLEGFLLHLEHIFFKRARITYIYYSNGNNKQQQNIKKWKKKNLNHGSL